MSQNIGCDWLFMSKAVNEVEKQLQQRSAKLLPRRIQFRVTTNPACGFLPPTCKFKPLNQLDQFFDPLSTETVAEESRTRIPTIPPLPSEISLQWKDIKPVGAGFKNLGNTDFINSVFQCFVYIPPLAQLVLLGLHQPKCKTQFIIYYSSFFLLFNFFLFLL